VRTAFQVGAAPAQSPQVPAFSAPSGASFAVVIDPAHGGTDSGARGKSGVNEKDLVLSLARAVRGQLAQQGYRVMMTRDADVNPTYDERAAMANALPEAIFISLHVSSTGAAGTARAYYYQFSAPFAYSATSPGSPASIAFPAPPPTAPGLEPWREAQRPFAEASQRLAGALQADLAQQFSGSPGAANAASVRELRSVAAPAAAVEVSSVAVPNPAAIAAMAAPLSAAIAKGVSDFHPAPPPAAGPTSAAGDAR
jgi:N-acetylmuramoyl-L-alanine amidase